MFWLVAQHCGILLNPLKVTVAQLCPTICETMDYTVHGILQARILEWVAFPFSRASSQPRVNPGLPHCRQILYQLSHKGSPRILEWIAYPFSSGSSWPRNQTGVSCIAGGFFTNWATREALLNPLGKPILETNLAGDTHHQFLAKFHYFKKSCTKMWSKDSEHECSVFWWCWFGVWVCVYRVLSVLTICKGFYGEGNGTPLQYSCLENPMDRGAW